jgi:hypothetical protein
MNQLDKFDTLIRLHTLLPNHALEHARIFRQLENESAAWSTYPQEEFKARVDVRLEALCRDCRERNVSTITLRRREANSDSYLDRYFGFTDNRPVSRADALKWTAGIALDFNLELDAQGEKVYVNITRFHSEGKFTIATIEKSWLPDFKRLHRELFLKDDARLYVRSTSENRLGKIRRREVPVISVAASAKYSIKVFDEVLLTAETINSNSLDLTFDNIRIPSLERTERTARMNEKLLTDSVKEGLDTSRVWDKSTFEWGDVVRPEGTGPDSYQPQEGVFDPRG